MIIKEICHNIVKHSQAKSVQFSMSQEDSRLKIVIHDDGIGISDSSSRGNGLTSIANRVKKINAHITYTNHNGTQYTIVITLTPDMPKS
jgi:two-component system sensor histidine kinase DesK